MDTKLLFKLEFEYYLSEIGAVKYALKESYDPKASELIGWILYFGHEIGQPGRGIFISLADSIREMKIKVNKYYQQIFGTKLKDPLND